MLAPPVIPAGAVQPTPLPPPVSAARRLTMLIVLLVYVAGIGVLAALHPDATGPALPETRNQMILVCVRELGLFAVVAGIAFWIGRPSRTELYLGRSPGWRGLAWSLLWSVAIRLFAIPFMLAYALGLQAYRTASGTGTVSLEQLRPKFENLVSPEAFNDPVYFILAATLLSFGLGGFREELWRAGVIAAFLSLLPPRWRNPKGQAAGILLAAVVFGGAHVTQDTAGVVATFAIGLALGVIMVWRRSYWEAALAHGWFNATSMAALWAIQRYQPEALREILPR